jgi:hypothetical protein
VYSSLLTRDRTSRRLTSRFRTAAAIIENASLGGCLFAFNRVSLPMLGAGFMELILCAFFVVAYPRISADR